jgi:hypothetical protein
VQPTDLVSGRFSCFLKGKHGDRKEDERVTVEHPEALVTGGFAMKERILRIMITLSGIAAVALAGGATLKPW